jgi:hypothetical protein
MDCSNAWDKTSPQLHLLHDRLTLIPYCTSQMGSTGKAIGLADLTDRVKIINILAHEKKLLTPIHTASQQLGR